jgi:hypothetical protein
MHIVDRRENATCCYAEVMPALVWSRSLVRRGRRHKLVSAKSASSAAKKRPFFSARGRCRAGSVRRILGGPNALNKEKFMTA